MVNSTLVSFADSRFTRSAKRFKIQAQRMNLFDKVQIKSEESLQPAFLEHFERVMVPENRGFGFFCWKPQVILEELTNSRDGDLIIYLDVGSHLFSNHSKILAEYMRLCAVSHSGILAFQTEFKEKFWTKADLFQHLGVRKVTEISDSGQVQAGLIMIRNSPKTRELVSMWSGLFWENLSYLDDSPSKARNFQGFMQSRHDQSAFSLLTKMYGATLLPAEGQTAPLFSTSCLRRSPLPVLHLRDITPDTDQNLLERLHFYGKPLANCAYRKVRGLAVSKPKTEPE